MSKILIFIHPGVSWKVYRLVETILYDHMFRTLVFEFIRYKVTRFTIPDVLCET